MPRINPSNDQSLPLPYLYRNKFDYENTGVRKNLADKIGLRKKFRAVFTRFGKKVNYNGYTDTTLLLTNIIDLETNAQVTDHHWFAFTKGFEKANLKEGISLEFEARVKQYKKGYVNRKLAINNQQSDYKLSHPTNIKVLAAGE